MNTDDGRGLPRLTRNLDQAKSDLTEWGYCLVADAISEDLRKRLLDRLMEQAILEGEMGAAYMAEGHGPMRRIGGFTPDDKPVRQ